MTGKAADPSHAKKPDADEAAKYANSIVAIARLGDRKAFAMLFEHFAPRIKAYMFRSSRDEALAEELAQEALMQVWRKAHLFDPKKAAASTWIFTIARNLRIDHLRRRKHIEIDEADPSLIADEAPQADDLVDRDQQAALIQAALLALPDDQKSVIELSFFEDCSHSEIASRLTLPLGTVKSRLRLAIGKLRGVIEDCR